MRKNKQKQERVLALVPSLWCRPTVCRSNGFRPKVVAPSRPKSLIELSFDKNDPAPSEWQFNLRRGERRTDGNRENGVYDFFHFSKFHLFASPGVGRQPGLTVVKLFKLFSADSATE
jgi:hypothetical protein